MLLMLSKENYAMVSEKPLVTGANRMILLEVWIFNGSRSAFPSAVFQNKEIAVKWIKANLLSGTLTKYPVDVSVYDWAITKGYFKPCKPDQQSPEFIGRFSSASQEHFHFEDGEEA